MKVNIEQQLDAKRQTSIDDATNFVQDVKSLMAADSVKERTNLKEIGLGFSIIKAEEKLGVDLERKAFESELGAKTFSESEVKELCLKYDLRLLSTKFFVGAIEPSVGADLTNFLEKNAINARHVGNDFFVMAPPSAFMLQDMPAPPAPQNVDPVLFYRVRPRDVSSKEAKPYYVLVKKWGNDFTVGRLVLGWMKRSPQNSFAWQAVIFSLVLTALFSFVFTAHSFAAVVVALGIGTFVSFLSNASVDGKVENFKKAEKRFNITKWNTNWK